MKMIASMRMHEISAKNCKIQDKENILKKPKLVNVAQKKSAFQSNAVVSQGIEKLNKKIKVATKVPVENQKEEKVKPVVDSDLLKIVPSKKATKNNDPKSSLDKKISNSLSEDIWNYYKKVECLRLPKPNYMDHHPVLTWNMRSIVVDWLVCVASEYDLSQEALYLAVNYIDRFLSKMTVIPEKMQLIGATTMLIAAKMEEIYPPTPKEWSYLTCDTYSTKQIKRMEQFIVKVLEFNLQPPTSYTFLKSICDEYNIDETTTNLAKFVAELSLLEGKHYLNYKPSEIAASSILLARLYLAKSNIWPREIEKRCGYSVKHLSPIVESQNATLKNSPHGKGQSIKEKYSSSSYGRVALIKPRRIVYDEQGDEEIEKNEHF